MRSVSPLVLLLLASLALSACGGGTPEAAVGGAEMRIRWVLPEAFPAEVTLHRALGDERDQPAWLMKTYLPEELGAVVADVGEEIPGGNMRVTLDEPERVVVVVRNPLDQPVRFWVAPHLPTPHSAEPALMVRCLCTGETYEVPANGAWTRVLEFGIRRRQAVDTLIVTHVITLGDAPAIAGTH